MCISTLQYIHNYHFIYATQIHDIAHSHSPHNVPHSLNITEASLIKYVAFTDVHNTMLNATTRLAISINNFPPWEFDWSDNRPQKSRHTLTLSELLPNAEDGQQLYDRAVAYTMKLLVESFPSLEKLKPLISTGNSAPVTKSDIVPMTLLFKDEKYIDDNIQILQQYIKGCNLSGNAQVCNV